MKRPQPELPKIEESGRGYRETHPAYAMVGAARVCGSTLLFGSDLQHQNYMEITVRKADIQRDLSRDWSYAGDELICVKLSEAQWATFVSAPNTSFGGVQCTLEHIQGTEVPQIAAVQEVKPLFARESAATLQVALDKLDQLEKMLETAIPGKKAREILSRQVEQVRMNMTSNLSFVADQFNEHMEDTVAKAKMEVNAHIQGIVARTVMASLQASQLAGKAPDTVLGIAETANNLNGSRANKACEDCGSTGHNTGSNTCDGPQCRCGIGDDLLSVGRHAVGCPMRVTK
jgi:predicted component of type VI protein secretion system